ncbi:tudor domain-containing 6 isoform X1 [Astyanax mexicanus]|uniref:tudor domain-containing 6 isoform X1 n=1 Tax=Astyanax mexicanus TaxID=7994 RepID=UPI0020CB4F28|nr:tudor domain-containing 6 isoform X1 [Astyanax mexicanus]
MCSLHVLPTIGSNVTVHITSVNLHSDSAFVEFGGTFNHVQLTKEIYQQMKKDIHMHKEKDCKFKGNPGALCLVREEKNCHRARILSRCGDQYNVFLIDDGRTLWASNNIMSWGHTSFFNLPPLMELFILASASPLPPENRWSPTASKFLKSLTGKTVSGCVQDVMMPSRMILLDIPSVFKQMHEFGFARKIPCGQFQILVEDSLHSPRDVSWPGSPLTNVQIEFANKIESCHQFLCPELMPGTIETVEVTHVVNPFTVFCKLQVFSHELKRLNKQIQEYCENTSALMPTPLSDGCPCATKGSDGMWYRSVWQKHVMSDVAKVFHVDYGREDFVKLKDVRPLSAEFFRLPVVTYACSLYGIKDKGTGWTTSQIDWLKSILLDQILVGKFEHRSLADGIYHVTLYGNNNVNINNSFAVHEKCSIMSERDSFCSKETPKSSLEHTSVTQEHSLDHFILPKKSGFAWTRLSTMEDSPEDLKSTYQGLHSDFSNPFEGHSVLNEHLFKIGTVVEVNVSYVESDQTFWCQMADSVPSLKMLMEDMQRRYSCSQFQMLIGSICVACHPNNGMWYRAHVLNHQLNSSQVDVRLIDYGQRLKVPLQDLRPIDSEFLKLKRQAFQCSLFNKVNSVSSEDTALSDSAFSDSFDLISSASLDNATLKFTICAVMYDPQGTMLNVVDIESLSPNCRTALIQKEANSSAVDSLDTYCVLNSPQADSSHHINLHTKEKVWITCVKGVDHFYGQFKPNAAMVEKLTKDVQQFCGMTHPKGNNFLPQMMCIARYKDGQLYRGQIKSVNPKIIVHFVDYGDLLILDESDLLPFPAEPSANMSLPFQAVKFSLFNVSLEESTTELNAWFESYATDRMFTATIMGKGPNGELLVEMHDGKTNINVKAKEKWNEIQNKECNARRQDINQLSHGLVKPLGRRDNSNSNLQADQGYRKAQKSADHTSSTGHNVKNVQCTDFAVCASGPIVSLKMEKQKDNEKPVPSYSKLKDLPSRIMNAGCVSEGYISHCNSPSSFFVQLACEDSDIFSLVDKLNCSQLCESQVEYSQLMPGHLVKAQYPSDGAWYRAVVKNKLDNCTILVEFIDYGNEAILSASKVRQLDMQFLKFPRYSIHCCINVGNAERKKEWTEEQMDIFKNVIVANGERKLRCNFIEEKESVWQVGIQDQSLLNLESTLELKSCNTSTTVCSRGVCPGVYKKPDVSLGQTIKAYASSVVDPNFFWCQFADSEKLDKISSIAQETGNSAQTNRVLLDNLSQGDSCLALFPDDNLWYRAQVIDKSVSSVSVLFVDYGNESELDQTSVRSVPASLLEIPPQAFLCQVEGFKAVDGCWNEAASGRFTELLVDKPLNVIIQNVKMASDLPFCHQYSVQIECNKVCISDLMKDYWNDSTANIYGQMTEEVFLKPMTVTDVDVLSPTSVNKTWDTTVTSVPSVKCVPKVTDLPPTTFEQDCVSEVYISHIISPDSFFVQLAKDENGLVSLTEELNSISSSVNNQAQMNYFPHGSLVKAVFPDDNSWYRAVIKETNGKDIHVEFIDFGNEATVPATSVRKLEEQFLQVPRFSIHCSLKRDHPTGILIGMEKETCPLAAVLKKAGEKRLFCKFIKKNKTVWEVNLADQRSTLDGLPLEIWDDFSTLQNDSPKQDMPFKKPEISVGQTVEAYASSMDGPNYFWCQGANSEGLDTISLIAQEAGNSAEIACIQIDELCQGDPCLALFTDKLWYRAKVIKKSQKSVSVLFVDYGNESENESGSVKPLPLSLLERPLQAFLCQLEGFSPSGGSWNSNATDKFWELVVDKPLTLTVTNIQNDLDSPFPSYCVKVQSQECVVNEQMKSFWTAAVCPNDESPKLPLSNADTVPVVCNVQSVPEKRLHEIYDNSQENIKTLSDFKPQSFSPFEKQEQEETFRQIVHIKEECEEIEVTQRTLATRYVCLINGDESSLALDKCVSKSKDEFRGINVKCSSKSFQNGQLDKLLPCVGMSETASSNEYDQTLVNQENSDVPYSQADLVGCKAELDEMFQKMDV